MTDEEILQHFGMPPGHLAHVPIQVFIRNLKSLVAKARRQALHDAADDFEAGASPDDIRSNADRT